MYDVLIVLTKQRWLLSPLLGLLPVLKRTLIFKLDMNSLTLLTTQNVINHCHVIGTRFDQATADHDQGRETE